MPTGKRALLSKVLIAMGGLFVSYSFWAPPWSFGDAYIHHWETHHEAANTTLFAPKFLYYSTKSNFDPRGSVTSINNLKQYTRLVIDLDAAYGLTRSATLFGRISWLRNEINHSTLSGNVFGFGEQTIGMNFRLLQPGPSPKVKRFSLDFQVQADIPFYSNQSAKTNNTPFLGDSSKDIMAGFFLSLPMIRTADTSLILTGGGGYTHRFVDFSSAIPWSLVLDYSNNQSEGIFGALSALGFQSLRTDSNAQTGNVSGAGLGAGGSFIVNAINPSLLTVRGEVGYRFGDNLALSASASQAVWGQAVPSGFMISFGLQTRFDRHRTGDDRAKPSGQKEKDKDYDKANQGFISYGTEAKVIRVHDRLNLIKIDKGRKDGVDIGQIFDIFSIRKDGSMGEAVARAESTSVDLDDAQLKVIEYFREVWIEEGFIAKRALQ